MPFYLISDQAQGHWSRGPRKHQWGFCSGCGHGVFWREALEEARYVYVQNNKISYLLLSVDSYNYTFYCLSFLNYFFFFEVFYSVISICLFSFPLPALLIFLPLFWLTSVYGVVGVFLQERIYLITLTMALMKTHGRHIVKNRRGCEWDSRSLQSAQWPARSLWEHFLQFNVNVFFLNNHPGLLAVYTLTDWHLKLPYPKIDLLFQ